MPIQIRASAELGFILIAFEGVVDLAEFGRRAAPLSERAEFALLPLAMVDTTRAEQASGPSEIIRALAGQVAANVDTEIGPGAKLALVAPQDELFGLGRMYQMLRDSSPVEVRVFRERSEAEEWLGLPADYAELLKEVAG